MTTDEDRHPDTDAETNVQWKNITICLDWWCPCGQGWHVDEEMCTEVECGGCGRRFRLGHAVRATEVRGPVR